MLRRTFFAVMAVLAMSAAANAGTVYTWLVIDPPTTAGAGVSAIAGAGQSMVVNSSRSGANTWHLFAVDDADSSAGIRSFNVKVNGATATNLRAPTANFDTEPVYNDGSPSNIGFDLNRTTTPTIGGAQSPTNTVQVGNFGIGASNFQALSNAGSYQAAPVSGQWGVYSAGDGITSGLVGATGHQRSAVFLAEGTYAAGSPPTVDITTAFASGGTGFTNWIATGFPNAGSITTAVGTTNTLSASNPFVPEPATLTLVGLAVVGFGGLVGRRRS
jgi:hypothetical protein